MLSIVYPKCSKEYFSAISDLLRRYGVGNVVECDSLSVPSIPTGYEEVILVNSAHQFSNSAIRRVTFRTARLPKAFVVWDSPLQQQVFIIRVPLATFAEQQSIHQQISPTINALVQQKTLVSFTMHEFCSNSATSVGGSFSDSGVHQYFAKVAKGRGAQKLLDEIQMYQSLPADLKDYYPQLLFQSEQMETVSMGTHFQDFPNMRDLFLNGDLSAAEVAQILSEVLDYEYNRAFLEHKQPTPPNYLRDYHFHRVWRRLMMSVEIDPIFSQLLSAHSLEINGQRMANIPAMLRSIEDSDEALQRLDPGGVSPFIHADLHLGNIICDVKTNRFWLVDPRGYPVCDIYYDLGKLTQSTYSCYDLLHEGRHEVRYEVNGDVATINYHFLTPILQEQYADLDERLKPIINQLLDANIEGPDVDLRIRFNEAMHYCSLMPFHIHPEAQPSLAVPIFARGAKLLADVVGLLGISMDECAGRQAGGMERLAEMGHARWCFDS
ncbi:hypothetical protein N7517_008169 [Penicillium concentricum]|uniref:Aminoglycoside phosphotransferase domain-containing protein n=1 Tax=Penicillium concentricum TaxID=293559 RepID=A0A9W9RRV8_9EURO|nr:uncharacterized protein N7517_008169 [Penicillium concentricum]KAJ5365283.1 hypothetical protein N7517_008169 [Penicillium concentricum]